MLADNSKTPFTVVAEGAPNRIFIRDEEKFKFIWSLVHNDEYNG